jgi:hypothetical protein
MRHAVACFGRKAFGGHTSAGVRHYTRPAGMRLSGRLRKGAHLLPLLASRNMARIEAERMPFCG